MSSTSPKITCAILCYNYGRFLGQAIDSCLDQTLDASLYEVLVIDDGSTDETPEVCAAYGDRIRVSRTANQGFPASLGRAVTEARGEYVILLDADDYFLPDKLELFDAAFRNGAEFVVNGHEVITEDSPERVYGEGGQTSTIGFRKAPSLDVLPVNNELPFHIIGKAFGDKFIPAPLTIYRVHGESMTKRGGFRHAKYFADRFRECHLKCVELLDKPGWSAKRAELLKAAAHWRTEEVRERINSRIAERDRLKAFVCCITAGRVLADEGVGALRIWRTVARGILWSTGVHWRYR
ncbi:glycosyltransferase family 2 protein [Luteolibacter yonseiensis]|uniref:Glycosyltransferase family 2 protein n=1 Tax=Luteolibacter yonseiensis TaxID=1144680 RepID=A0A934VCG3_9BACT|nr:glycosyltransferase family A protein [Luteolibacter yonseiensis]MBK1817130.1 glycosyltransferase family 2 protein [Luteolibacter yonseiensis]